MKILFMDWPCFGHDDTLEAFRRLGHDMVLFAHDDYKELESETFAIEFFRQIKKTPVELVFSYNYFPILAEACKDANLPYISFIYDSPYVMLYSYTLMYPTNHVFLFDSDWVSQMRQGGLKNVHYMVLPGAPDKMRRMLKKPYDRNRSVADVSFVGTLYNEEHNFYERMMKKAPDYLKGYLEGVIEAQQKIYGYSLVEEMLTDHVMQLMRSSLDAQPGATFAEPPKYRYANYFLKRQITQRERIRLLTAVGERFGDLHQVKLFTVDEKFRIPGVKNMGVAGYETFMPYVFRNSRINLNITLRSIQTGIPLRCMDIMACGGFLLSNYQSDLVADFVPGQECDCFESPEDLLTKIEYYLSHEKERAAIAENGQQKVKEYFCHEKVLKRVLDIALEEQE